MSRQPTVTEHQLLLAYVERLKASLKTLETRYSDTKIDALYEENERLKAINKALTQRNQILANREKGLK